MSLGGAGATAGGNALRPLEPIGLGERTLSSIREAIVSGELAAGEPLRDRTLAAALGVSRTPVREALHRLEAAGLVKPRGRAGWEVTPFTEQDVRELFQLRMLLEPAGLDELAKKEDEQAVVRIGSFFDGYAHPIEDAVYADYVAHDNAFHNLLVECSGNHRLRRFYAVLETHIDRGRHFLTTAAVGRADETLDEHLAVTRAVAEKDFARARAELLRHLRTGEELMIEQLRLRSRQ